jgi:hypothetical protein
MILKVIWLKSKILYYLINNIYFRDPKTFIVINEEIKNIKINSGKVFTVNKIKKKNK